MATLRILPVGVQDFEKLRKDGCVYVDKTELIYNLIKTPKYCYVMEFKLDGTAEEALAQISSKDYTLPFTLDGQQIVRIGLNFDRKTRNIEKALVSPGC